MLRFISIYIVAMVAATGLYGQFTRASLQASGLTCAMCTRAIHNSLKQLPFVAVVKPDIKNSTFNIDFKEDAVADIDALEKAVEEAGFAIAKLKLTGSFENLAIKNDEHVNLQGKEYHFVNISNQVINGEKVLTIVDKNFLTAKEFKKISATTDLPCIQTGKAGSCCHQAGVAEGTRIYHVTI